MQNGLSSYESPQQTRRKRKATKMVAMVVFLFAAFWLPIQVLQLWMKFDENFPRTDPTYYFKIFAHALSYANSCVNPIVYSFMGDGFRKAMRKAFPVLARASRIHPRSRARARMTAEAASRRTEETHMDSQSQSQSQLDDRSDEVDEDNEVYLPVNCGSYSSSSTQPAGGSSSPTGVRVSQVIADLPTPTERKQTLPPLSPTIDHEDIRNGQHAPLMARLSPLKEFECETKS